MFFDEIMIQQNYAAIVQDMINLFSERFSSINVNLFRIFLNQFINLFENLKFERTNLKF